jgi:hypothetical protein
MNGSNFLDSEWGIWTVMFGLSFTIAPDLGPFVLLAFIVRIAYLVGRAVWRALDRAGSATLGALRRRAEKKDAEYAGPSEQELKEAEERAKLRVQHQQRREDARVACEMLFQLHAHALGDRFSKEVFEDFMRRYLGDARAPEDVESRAKQLQEIILQHVQQIDPPAPTHTIDSLTKWYQQTKALIDSLDVAERYKQAQLISLNRRYVDLMQALLENLQP